MAQHVSIVGRVAAAGADFAIRPDNTCHQAFPYLLPKSPIPWPHIAEVVTDEAARRRLRDSRRGGAREGRAQ